MRTSKNLLSIAFLAFALTVPTHGETAAEVLADAHRTYLRGEAADARLKFLRVLEMEPNNLTAARYVRVIDVELKRSNAGKGMAEARVKKVTLPSIELNDATLPEALDYVKQKCNQVLGPKEPLNMVLMLSETAKTRKVTLNLKNVPASEVFRYVCDQGNVQVSYDEHSMIVRDRAPAPPPKPGS